MESEAPAPVHKSIKKRRAKPKEENGSAAAPPRGLLGREEEEAMLKAADKVEAKGRRDGETPRKKKTAAARPKDDLKPKKTTKKASSSPKKKEFDTPEFRPKKVLPIPAPRPSVAMSSTPKLDKTSSFGGFDHGSPSAFHRPTSTQQQQQLRPTSLQHPPARNHSSRPDPPLSAPSDVPKSSYGIWGLKSPPGLLRRGSSLGEEREINSSGPRVLLRHKRPQAARNERRTTLGGSSPQAEIKDVTGSRQQPTMPLYATLPAKPRQPVQQLLVPQQPPPAPFQQHEEIYWPRRGRSNTIDSYSPWSPSVMSSAQASPRPPPPPYRRRELAPVSSLPPNASPLRPWNAGTLPPGHAVKVSGRDLPLELPRRFATAISDAPSSSAGPASSSKSLADSDLSTTSSSVFISPTAMWGSLGLQSPQDQGRKKKKDKKSKDKSKGDASSPKKSTSTISRKTSSMTSTTSSSSIAMLWSSRVAQQRREEKVRRLKRPEQSLPTHHSFLITTAAAR